MENDLNREQPAAARDIVVIGGSAGAIEALRTVIALLPRSFPAAVFVVVHVLRSTESRLPGVLAARGSLPVAHARQGDPIVPGRVLVAPPDWHLLLRPDHVELSHGPTENQTRPAIDPLFRSAAESFGPRVCGVVLSGMLDDGAAGLRRVVSAGGLGLVQDPEDAIHPEMPANALAAAPGSLRTPMAAMAPNLLTAVGAPPAGVRAAAISGAAPSNGDGDDPPERTIAVEDQLGEPTGLTCPQCHGVLWADPRPDEPTLVCRTGHRFSLQTLEEDQRQTVEDAMWAAVRGLREEATLAAHIGQEALRAGRQSVALRFMARERTALRHVKVLEDLLSQPWNDEEREEAEEA
ncbi:MAG: chemotaxis protein CheB [Candidatus Dormibacteraeota bacterium]|nr:chemotaxis protein CheB [Candidatus Dormibacteraeota bacterium]